MEAEEETKSISILGCGWYGFAVAKALLLEGYSVKGSCTSNSKFEILKQTGIEPFQVIFEAESEIYAPEFFSCDILIIAIPPKRRSGEANSYIQKISRIKEAIVHYQIKRVVFISSTSVYGDHNTEVNEDTVPLPDTESGKAIHEAENLLEDHPLFKTTILRFGGLIGPERNPARFFSGKTDIPNGNAPINLIHLEDCIAVTMSVIKKDVFGNILNACSSNHPLKKDFYTEAAKKSGLNLPQFRDELSQWKIVSSTRMEPSLGLRLTKL